MEDKLAAHFAALKKVSYILMDKMLADMKRQEVPLKFSHIKAIATFAEDRSYSIKELAENGMIKVPNMSTMIDELIQNGIARKKKDQTDRRKVLVTLTPKGKKLREQFFANRRTFALAMFAKLSEQKQAELLGSLEKVCALLEEVVE